MPIVGNIWRGPCCPSARCHRRHAHYLTVTTRHLVPLGSRPSATATAARSVHRGTGEPVYLPVGEAAAMREFAKRDLRCPVPGSSLVHFRWDRVPGGAASGTGLSAVLYLAVLGILLAEGRFTLPPPDRRSVLACCARPCPTQRTWARLAGYPRARQGAESFPRSPRSARWRTKPRCR